MKLLRQPIFLSKWVAQALFIALFLKLLNYFQLLSLVIGGQSTRVYISNCKFDTSTRYLGGRTGILHELAQSNTMSKSVAKESRGVPYPEAIVPYLVEAHQLALEGRPGPVHDEIPLDLLDSEIAGPSILEINATVSICWDGLGD